jgi:hypothetical protein
MGHPGGGCDTHTVISNRERIAIVNVRRDGTHVNGALPEQRRVTGELATRMSITPDIAAALLTCLADTGQQTPVNGSAITVGVGR